MSSQQQRQDSQQDSRDNNYNRENRDNNYNRDNRRQRYDNRSNKSPQSNYQQQGQRRQYKPNNNNRSFQNKNFRNNNRNRNNQGPNLQQGFRRFNLTQEEKQEKKQKQEQEDQEQNKHTIMVSKKVQTKIYVNDIAKTLLEWYESEENRNKKLVLSAMGPAVPIALSAANVIREKIGNLHQNIEIKNVIIQDTFTNQKNASLEPVVIKRDMGVMNITLSFSDKDLAGQPGYQGVIHDKIPKKEDIVLDQDKLRSQNQNRQRNFQNNNQVNNRYPRNNNYSNRQGPKNPQARYTGGAQNQRNNRNQQQRPQGQRQQQRYNNQQQNQQ